MAYTVEFVSPESTLYSGQAVQVVARTRGGGDIAFLQGHQPFIGSLLTCEVKVTEEGGDERRFAVRGGFVSVAGSMAQTTVTVLSDAAQDASEIDAAAARRDLEEAQQELASNPNDPYAKDNLRWAEVRLAILGAE